MSTDEGFWSALGACLTAVFAFLTWRNQRKSLRVQKEAVDIQKKTLDVQSLSLTIQEKIHKGQALLSLERNGEYIAVVLQNTGDEEISDIRIKTVPVLAVPNTTNKGFYSVSRTWVIPDIKHIRLLPHQIMRDDTAFLATDFDKHFQGDFSITATLEYTQSGLNITSTQILDSAMIRRMGYETKMRKSRE